MIYIAVYVAFQGAKAHCSSLEKSKALFDVSEGS